MIISSQINDSSRAVDLHDLVTIFMYEIAILDPSLRSCELLDYSKHEGDGPVPEDKQLTAISPGHQEDYLNCTKESRVAMVFQCKKSNESDDDDQENTHEEKIYRSTITVKQGFKTYVEETYPEFDLRDVYWRSKSQSIGLAHYLALQKILDRLPENTGLRIRTSQGHEHYMKEPKFRFSQVYILPRECAFIYKAKEVDESDSKLSLELLVVGEEKLKWTVIEFDSDSGEKSALDIAPMLLGLHGLGGEYFVLERLSDYYGKFFLMNRAESGRTFRSKGFLRIWKLSVESTAIALALIDRVSHRLVGVFEKKDTFCNFCGKPFVKKLCGKCGKVQYCDKYCQTKGWSYHKKWCKKISEE